MRLTRLRTLVAAALAATGLLAAAGATAPAWADGVTSYTLPGSTAYPESITQRPGSTTFFVSGYGDGSVYRGTVGTAAMSVFVAGDSNHTVAAGVKDDGQGHLFVVRGRQQLIDVYDDTTGALVTELSTASFGSGGMLNDIAFGPDGTGYVTDSYLPYVFRITRDSSGAFTVDKWLSLSGTAMTYTSGGGVAGVNANGLAVTPDGRYLLLDQTNKDALFRVEISSGTVAWIDTSGADLGYPDGFNLVDGTGYIAGNTANIVSELTFNSDYSKATLVRQLTDPAFAQPSAALPVDGSLLVTEFQHNTATPSLPFTVTALPLS
ncbi:SMP-30/gluconolactonase/LRE family protein [Streptantibioticus cattleyicolor]|uniref:Superoxide dismutase n=1 Tax=Streptantibioticus cattleyicolor (strain ATCC 35852 / DSM 46488 / JCM 4925 / NBRC 14057 / NRRL 8057) TaxID=1003195 RepID=F8JJY9_STREN|nr:hypothetical protein [Streptantibioticus cattleyicolor]AEW98579.1 superoxide dismutase [Streptantibioticus cattleyicolor NRRL 8057 = DSM 46488]CCB72363.1 conserved exported protein of unknown function [Streptantibioticus cattleyicolor NRRL 8057 = DSM 46488]